MHGKTGMDIRIGHLRFPHKTIVCDIIDDVILRLDIISKFVLYMEEQMLKVGSEKCSKNTNTKKPLRSPAGS